MNKGFTLISILIAMIILVIGLLSIMSLLPVGGKGVRRARTSQIAALIAEREIACIKSIYSEYSSPEPPAYFSGIDESHPLFSYKGRIFKEDGLYDLNFTVFWKEEGEEKREVFQTKFTKR